MGRPVVGEGCRCVRKHTPASYVAVRHHILPQSWNGPTVEWNLVTICPNTHTATHRLLDEYVRAGGDPGVVVRRQFGRLAQWLAKSAWEQRPANPTITSLSH